MSNVEDWSDKFANIPAPVRDKAQRMIVETHFGIRDNYRAELKTVIDFCNWALTQEVNDRAKKRASKGAKRG